jgi:hypothetical protein
MPLANKTANFIFRKCAGVFRVKSDNGTKQDHETPEPVTGRSVRNSLLQNNQF